MKEQIDLFKYGNPYLRNRKIHLFLPCSKVKPYKNSKSHRYIHQKLKENLPSKILSNIQINTVSEVIGIIPEHLENEIFKDPGNYYDNYPNDFDIERVSSWLINYILQNPSFSECCFLFYATAPTFRSICEKTNEMLSKTLLFNGGGSIVNLKLVPTEVNEMVNPITEFRKNARIKELIAAIPGSDCMLFQPVNLFSILEKRGKLR